MWFIFALLVMLFWGTADLFYKKSADQEEKHTHLKTVAAVGIVMGAHAIFTLLTNDLNYDFKNILMYLPVSSMYILSMAIGYFGLRYLELSISSPIQNTSGIIVSILCFLILKETMGPISVVAIAIIAVGLLALGILERKANSSENPEDRKYKIGFVAFLMPILYCIIDSLGTFFDAYYLSMETTPLVNITEETMELVANVSYELTFLIAAIVCLIFLIIKKSKTTKETVKNNFLAAIFETAGQFFYVYALSGNAIIAAPMVASYCVVSMILSRIFLKEKLTKKEYVSLILIIIGIIILGVVEEL
ncbi:MAG: DMT family transporter [Clostridia bacterium]|nr:DMT family transporter [Clostridia bacterium]